MCNEIANKSDIKQRQRFTRESEQLLRDACNSKHPKRIKQARKAKKRLKTTVIERSRNIADKMLRELAAKMTPLQREVYQNDTSTALSTGMKLYRRAVNTSATLSNHQQKTDTNKVYSLHKPFTKCIANGSTGSPTKARRINRTNLATRLV